MSQTSQETAPDNNTPQSKPRACTYAPSTLSRCADILTIKFSSAMTTMAPTPSPAWMGPSSTVSSSPTASILNFGTQVKFVISSSKTSYPFVAFSLCCPLADKNEDVEFAASSRPDAGKQTHTVVMIEPTLEHNIKTTSPRGKCDFDVTVVAGLDLAAPRELGKLTLVSGRKPDARAPAASMPAAQRARAARQASRRGRYLAGTLGVRRAQKALFQKGALARP